MAQTDSMTPEAMSTSQFTGPSFPAGAGRGSRPTRAPRPRFLVRPIYSSITIVGLSRVMICLAKISAPR